ncbi:MAG: alpha/beta hydrolase [Acidimicrobiales bacterium]
MPYRDPILVPSSDGVTIAVHDLGGDESAETLVICHATGFCGRAYQALADELTGRFHVMALDFRGHGDSTVPANGNFDWAAMAGDLLAAVDAIAAPGPVVGFGHSLGGGALMLAEARRPGTLRAAHLYEPIVLPTGLPTSPPSALPTSPPSALPADLPHPGGGPDMMSIAARRRRATFASKAEAIWRYSTRPPLNVLQSGCLAAYVEHGMRELPDGSVQLKCSPDSEAATFEAAGKPTIDTIRGVLTPTTVAIGTTERGWTPAGFGPAIAEALPHGRLDGHPLLGHFGPLQGPVTVGAMILDALF